MPADAAGFSGMAVSEDTANAPASVATMTYEPVLERIRQVPGVESAALVTSPPLSGMDLHSSFDILGQSQGPQAANKPSARVSAVSGGLCASLGTPIVRGRMIGDGDALTAPFVAVVNETLVKKYFAGNGSAGKADQPGWKRHGNDQAIHNRGGAGRPGGFERWRDRCSRWSCCRSSRFRRRRCSTRRC